MTEKQKLRTQKIFSALRAKLQYTLFEKQNTFRVNLNGAGASQRQYETLLLLLLRFWLASQAHRGSMRHYFYFYIFRFFASQSSPQRQNERLPTTYYLKTKKPAGAIEVVWETTYYLLFKNKKTGWTHGGSMRDYLKDFKQCLFKGRGVYI